MKHLIKIILLIASLVSGCANDGAIIQVKGDFTAEEFAMLESAAQKWCNAGFDCVQFTRGHANDTIEFVSEVKCGQMQNLRGCTSYRSSLTDEHIKIQILNQKTSENWNQLCYMS